MYVALRGNKWPPLRSRVTCDPSEKFDKISDHLEPLKSAPLNNTMHYNALFASCKNYVYVQ